MKWIISGVLALGMLAFPALVSDRSSATGVSSATEEEEYEFGVLKDAEGVLITYYTCAGCHSERIVAQQGLTRDEWDELLDWMIDEQGMGEPATEDRFVILDYLSTHYNVDRPNFPGGVPN
ncbi:MAG: aldehyde dehydrogenase [Pseudomonadota bacterium]